MYIAHQAVDESEATAALRKIIESGNYKPGSRLPSERELTSRLDVTRATLRKSLDSLEREGVIWRHVGKGTFISSANQEDSSANAYLDLGRQLTPFRMMRARLTIEPAIAREAAVNASGTALMKMQTAIERTHSASNWHDYEIQDDLFHRAIAEASDNLLLLSLFDKLNTVRRAVAWGSVVRDNSRPQRDHSSFAEHDAIATAIKTRNGEEAYELMRKHLHSVSRRLFEED